MRHHIRAFAPVLASLLVLASAAPRVRAAEPDAWPGVTVTALNDGWRDESGYRGAGVLVTAVTPSSAADQVGIVAGDVLVSIGTVALRDAGDLDKARDRVDPSHDIPVVIARNNGRLMTVKNIEGVPTPADQAEAEDNADAAPAPAAEVAPAPDAAPEAAPAPEAAAAPEAAPAAPETPAAPADPWAAFGARCADLNADLAAALGVSADAGVLVLSVTNGGAAERAGIRAGDVITEAAGEPVTDAAALAVALNGLGAGLALHTQRGDAERDVTASLVAHAAPSSAASDDDEAGALRDELQSLRREIELLRAERGQRSN